MPPLSNKNQLLSIHDMGLGDLLNQQVSDETEEAKRRRMMEARRRALNPQIGDVLGQGPRDIMGGFFGR